MKFTRAAIHDVVICEPNVRGDERSCFFKYSGRINWKNF